MSVTFSYEYIMSFPIPVMYLSLWVLYLSLWVYLCLSLWVHLYLPHTNHVYLSLYLIVSYVYSSLYLIVSYLYSFSLYHIVSYLYCTLPSFPYPSYLILSSSVLSRKPLLTAKLLLPPTALLDESLAVMLTVQNHEAVPVIAAADIEFKGSDPKGTHSNDMIGWYELWVCWLDDNDACWLVDNDYVYWLMIIMIILWCMLIILYQQWCMSNQHQYYMHLMHAYWTTTTKTLILTHSDWPCRSKRLLWPVRRQGQSVTCSADVSTREWFRGNEDDRGRRRGKFDVLCEMSESAGGAHIAYYGTKCRIMWGLWW